MFKLIEEWNVELKQDWQIFIMGKINGHGFIVILSKFDVLYLDTVKINNLLRQCGVKMLNLDN